VQTVAKVAEEASQGNWTAAIVLISVIALGSLANIVVQIVKWSLESKKGPTQVTDPATTEALKELIRSSKELRLDLKNHHDSVLTESKDQFRFLLAEVKEGHHELSDEIRDCEKNIHDLIT
jgi:hypothetical protein